MHANYRSQLISELLNISDNSWTDASAFLVEAFDFVSLDFDKEIGLSNFYSSQI